MARLINKICLVTGAAQGIGAGIARAFVKEGAEVVLTDVREQEGQASAQELGGAASFERLDVRLEQDWIRVVREVIGRWGRLDVVVNNAGVTGFEQGPRAHDPEHAELADFRAVHETNLDGVFLGCKHAIRAMRSRGTGAIINIGSRSGVVGIPAAAAYASSKAAVRNHTRSVALYCAEQGLRIRCNVIQPAAILTPLWEPMLGSGPDRETRIRALSQEIPLRRFGTVEEVAALAVYLASDESAYATGTEYQLDGGLLAGTAAVPKTANAGSQ